MSKHTAFIRKNNYLFDDPDWVAETDSQGTPSHAPDPNRHESFLKANNYVIDRITGEWVPEVTY